MAHYNENVQLLNMANLYNNIKPGDITHSDVERTYNEYFAKFGRRMKLFVHSPSSCHLQQLPCFVFQVAFDLCIELVLTGPIKVEFNEKVKDYEIPQPLVQILKDSDEIRKMFQLHSVILTEQSNKNRWEILKAAYGCLLYISQAKSYQQLSLLTEKILSYVDVNGKYCEDSLEQMAKQAVELAWNMVMLIPPALVFQPVKYIEDWHDKRITSWNNDDSPNPFVYFRPVLFYSCLGHVGCKGVIGNTTPKNIELINCHSIIKSYNQNENNEDSLHNDSLSSVSSFSQPNNEEQHDLSQHPTTNDDKTASSEKTLYQLLVTHNEKLTINSDKTSDHLTFNKIIDQNDLADRKIITSEIEKNMMITNQLEIQISQMSHTTEPNITDVTNSVASVVMEQHQTKDNSCIIAENNTLPSNEISTVNVEDAEASDQRLEVLNISNLYNNIKPGDYTHHHALLGYKSYFSRFNKRMKVYVVESTGQMAYLFPCFVLKVTYNECVQYLLNSQQIECFQKSLLNYALPEKLKILTRAEVVSHLRSIFDDNLKIDTENWELLKAAFACYLHLSNARSHDSLIDNVLSKLPANTHLEQNFILEMVKEAVELAWKMVTLIPPALVVQPLQYEEDWHDKKTTSWDDNASPNPSIYFCSVLFYDSLGQIGCKGVIGNKLSTDAIVLCEIMNTSTSEENKNDGAVIFDNVVISDDYLNSISWKKVPYNEDGFISIYPCSLCANVTSLNADDVCNYCCEKMLHNHDNTVEREICKTCCCCCVIL